MSTNNEQHDAEVSSVLKKAQLLLDTEEQNDHDDLEQPSIQLDDSEALSRFTQEIAQKIASMSDVQPDQSVDSSIDASTIESNQSIELNESQISSTDFTTPSKPSNGAALDSPSSSQVVTNPESALVLSSASDLPPSPNSRRSKALARTGHHTSVIEKTTTTTIMKKNVKNRLSTSTA